MKRLPVVGYEGIYEVAENGVIYSLDRIILCRNGTKVPKKGIQLAQTIHKDTGYLMVSLWKNNSGENHYVHRVVAQAFIPNPKNKPEVNHKDSNRLNPKVTNLEWVTRSENALHGYQFGYGYQVKKLTETQLDESLMQFLGGITMTQIAGHYGIGLSRLTINLRKLSKQLKLEDAFNKEIEAQRNTRNKQANANKQKPVYCYYKNGDLKDVYPSITAAAKALGKKSSGSISNALNPDKTQATAYGYKWRYQN